MWVGQVGWWEGAEGWNGQHVLPLSVGKREDAVHKAAQKAKLVNAPSHTPRAHPPIHAHAIRPTSRPLTCLHALQGLALAHGQRQHARPQPLVAVGPACRVQLAAAQLGWQAFHARAWASVPHTPSPGSHSRPAPLPHPLHWRKPARAAAPASAPRKVYPAPRTFAALPVGPPHVQQANEVPQLGQEAAGGGVGPQVGPQVGQRALQRAPLRLRLWQARSLEQLRGLGGASGGSGAREEEAAGGEYSGQRGGGRAGAATRSCLGARSCHLRQLSCSGTTTP